MVAFETKLFSHCRVIGSGKSGTSKEGLFVLERFAPCSQAAYVYTNKRPNDYVWSSRRAKMLCVSIAMELHLCVLIVCTLSTKHTIAKLGPLVLVYHSFPDCRSLFSVRH